MLFGFAGIPTMQQDLHDSARLARAGGPFQRALPTADL
jgi:hypothetical protein